MKVSNLYELIQEGFVPHSVGPTKVEFVYTDEVDREKWPGAMVEDGQDVYTVDIDNAGEETLKQADVLMVWLHKTPDVVPEHLERFRDLRHMLMAEFSSQEWSLKDVPTTMAAVDAMIDANIERIKEAETVEVLLTELAESTLVSVDGVPMGLLHYVGVSMTAPESAPHVTLTFVSTVAREHKMRVIRRPLQIRDAGFKDGATWIEGEFLEGHELKGFIPEEEPSE